MRTEHDVRVAVADLAAAAHRAEHALLRLQLAPSRPAPRRPRLGWVVAVAALVVAVAVAIPLVVRGFEPAPADRRRAGYWAMVGQVSPPTGWRVTQRAVEGARELTGLAGPDESTCTVVVYGRSAPPDPLPVGEPRTVGGRRGIWVPERNPEPSELWWSYDDDAWALVACDPGDEARSLALAESLRLDAPYEFAIPYRLRSLPRGYSVRTVAEGGDSLGAGVMLAATNRPTISVGVTRTPFEPPGPGLPGVEEREINGRPATVREDQRAIQLTVEGGYVLISSAGGETQSWEPGELDALLDVADALQPADLRDPKSWPTARAALP